MQQYLLTILILLPAVGALAVGLHGSAPYARAQHYRWIALGFSALTFAVSLLLLGAPVGLGAGGTFHFVQDLPWVESVGAHYHRSEERRVGKECRSRWAAER